MGTAKVSFLLPIADNDGRDLSQEIQEVEARCYELFGAWSLSGYFKGRYKMSTGEGPVDTSAAYFVYVEEEKVGDVERILADFKKRAKQEKVLMEVQHHVDLRMI